MTSVHELQQSIEFAHRAARVCVAIGLAGVAIGAMPLPASLVGFATIATFVCATLGLLGAAHFSSVARMHRRELEAHRAGSMQRDLGA